MDNNSGLVIQARIDRAAFVQLYRRHYDTIFRYCVHRLFDRAAAEDVTSEVFLKMVENFIVSEAQKHSFATGYIKSQPMPSITI